MKITHYCWLVAAVEAARMGPRSFTASWRDRPNEQRLTRKSVAYDSHSYGTMPDDTRSCAASIFTKGGETCHDLVDASHTMLMTDLLDFNPELDCSEPLAASVNVCTELTVPEVYEQAQTTFHAKRAASKLVTYPQPPGEPAQTGYSVSVNGQVIFCYGTWQYMPSSDVTIVSRPVAPVTFCYFDFSGTVTVKIHALDPALPSGGKITSLGVRPASAGIKYSWTTSTQKAFTFQLSEPGQYTFEPNGLSYPIHIFANPIETDQPDPSDPNVLYFAAGVHTISPTNIDDNTVVYIAGGAVVNLAPVDSSQFVDTVQIYDQTIADIPPMIQAKWASNVTITGRGILCGRNALASANQRTSMIQLEGVNGGTISGIILRENGGWNINLPNSNRILVDNVKIVGHYVNHDGIVMSSSNSVVQNSFMHNADDGLEIKSWEGNPVTNVVFKNNIVWATVAGAMGIPSEVYSDVSGIVWQDSTVLHSVDPDVGVNRGSIGVNSQGPGTVKNLVFRNIVVEHTIANYVVRFNNNQEVEDSNDIRGPIRSINVTNVNVLQCRGCGTALLGQSSTAKVNAVNVASLAFKKTYLTSTKIKQNAYVANVSVTQ